MGDVRLGLWRQLTGGDERWHEKWDMGGGRVTARQQREEAVLHGRCSATVQKLMCICVELWNVMRSEYEISRCQYIRVPVSIYRILRHPPIGIFGVDIHHSLPHMISVSPALGLRPSALCLSDHTLIWSYGEKRR